MSLQASGLDASEAARPNYVYEFNPEVAEKWFSAKSISCELAGGKPAQPLRLGRYGVHGDGSCGYHTICAALNFDDYIHKTDEQQKQIAYMFRCSFADKIDKETLANVLKKVRGKHPTLPQLQDSLCDPKVWADETALRIVSQKLDLNLIFLDMEKNAVYCGMHHDDALNIRTLPKTMVVCWVGHSHFEPMCHILSVGKRVSEIKIILDPADSEVDARLVKALMGKYKDQCKIRR